MVHEQVFLKGWVGLALFLFDIFKVYDFFIQKLLYFTLYKIVLYIWRKAIVFRVRGGGTFWNSLNGGGTEKRGRETKILKRGRAGLRSGCLKKGDSWSPLTNYE